MNDEGATNHRDVHAGRGPVGAYGDGLSVVVISLGAPLIVREAIRSLQRQKPTPEIIVVNSGGGDIEFAVGGFDVDVVLTSERVMWPGEARNVGLDAASMRYVAFLACDCEAGTDWVSLRLKRHRAGAMVVTNAVANRDRWNPVSIACHAMTFGRRFPSLPAAIADRYGGSFDRHLFEEHGPFREDLRIGEDTEILSRIGIERTEWAPDIITIHQNPRTPLAAILDKYRRGQRFGYHWRSARGSRLAVRWYNRTRNIMPLIALGLRGPERISSWAILPFILALTFAHELGVRSSTRTRNRVREAMDGGDHERALAIERDAWSRLGSEATLLNIVDLLTALQRDDELRNFLAEVEAGRTAFWMVAQANVRRMELLHDWNGIIAYLDQHRHVMRRNVTLVAAYVAAMSLCGRIAEAGTVVAAYRGPRHQRAFFLQVEIMLSTGEREKAWKAYDGLPLKTKHLMPKQLFGAMFGAALGTGGTDAARRFLDSQTHDTNDAVFGLRKVIYTMKLESLVALSTGTPLPANRQRSEDRVPEVSSSKKLGGLFPDAIKQLREFRSALEGFHPDPSLLFEDTVAVARRMSTVISERQPFSLIRLGDGEGNLLPYRTEWASHCAIDFATTRRAWWGQAAAIDGEYDMLQEMLIRAIDGADIIGIPEVHRLANSMALNKNLRGLLASHDFLAAKLAHDPSWFDGRIITSCHVHQSLAYWGFWDLLIPKMREVSVITCHSALGEILSRRYGVAVISEYLLPPEAKFSTVFGRSPMMRHFPERFQELMAELGALRNPGIVLVAGGILGKAYGECIRANGGVAIDIGSFADHLCGHMTRSLEETSLFNGPKIDRRILAERIS